MKDKSECHEVFNKDTLSDYNVGLFFGLRFSNMPPPSKIGLDPLFRLTSFDFSVNVTYESHEGKLKIS